MQLQRSQSLMSDGSESQRLQLYISCRNLANLDIITVTDSFCIVKLIEPNKAQKQILKTKVYYNDLNPNYAQTILIDFVFEIKQKLIFEIYHQANPPKLVGKYTTSLGQIFGSPEHGLVKDLVNNINKKSGKIIIRSEKQQRQAKKFINFKLSAQRLPNIKTWWFFGGTCSFFRIFRKRQKDQILVYESETINYSVDPSFKQFKISERKLSSLDPNHNFEIRFYNYSNLGNHQLLGTSIIKLKDLQQVKKYDIVLNKKGNGTLVFENVKKSVQYSFIDFIRANLQLSLVTCIDFTASNRVATKQDSLHYCNNKTQSHYQKALLQVTNILMDYDYDKLIPVYGFGAKVSHPTFSSEGKVHHCFPINGNEGNPSLYGMQQIKSQYRNILKYLSFSGPTYFSSLLSQAIQQCQQMKSKINQYMILFILTDGQIHDRQQVINLIIKCNLLPISIIIVGVGNSDFTIMKQLDDDDCKMIDDKGNKTQRDLVQFVQFTSVSNNSVELARQVLEELPRQVAQYYRLIGKDPVDVAKAYQGKQTDILRILKELVVKGQNPQSNKLIQKANPYY